MHSHSLKTAVVLAAAIAVVNGLGRFAYALLLPVMRTDLQWDYTLSGWLNTANSLGYGLGALLGMLLLARWRPATLFIAGLAMTVVTLILCGLTRDIAWLLIWRLLAGVGSAWVFACGGALIASAYSNEPSKAANGIAIYYAGGGLGIAMSGLLLAPVLDGQWSWSVGWLILGLMGFALALWPAKLAARIGGATSGVSTQPMPWRPYLPMMIAYFLFGVGYIVYLTFVMAWLREMQLGVAASVGVWIWLGMAVMASGWIWRGVMARWWPARTFAAATLVTGIGAALPLLSEHLAMLLVSAMLVGGSFFMAPGAIMALTRQTLAPAHWAKMMSLMTLIFAVGQGIGPVLAGALADATSLNTAMGASVVVLVISAALALTQTASKKP
jgi:predicted MFS family arabinose efflux permease